MIQTLLLIASVTFLGAMSPGPDFFVVAKNAMLYGRKHGVATAIGVGNAIIVHCLIVAAGLGVIITNSAMIYQGIKIGGALYLLYLGIMLRRANIGNTQIIISEKKQSTHSYRSSWHDGFITNLFNPKFIVFVLALFAQVFPDGTTTLNYLLAGLTMGCTASVWFSILSYGIGIPVINKRLQNSQQRIHKIFGGLLIALGVKILIEK